MFDERPEEPGVGLGQFPVGVAHQTSLGGCGVGGDVRPGRALATLRAVDIEFGDVDGQAERLHFRQRLVHLFEADRNIEVGLRTDGMDRDLLFLQAT